MKCSSLSMNQSASFFYLFCILFSCITIIGNPVLASHEDTCDFPAIFNFGDGNSDTGAYSAAFGGVPPFYVRGRGANGRLIIDFLASSLGKPFLHAYLDSLGANFSYGANFANLLATIAPPKLILPVATPPRAFSPFYLDIQFAQFRLFVNQSQSLRKEGGFFEKLMPKKEYFSKALYTIDIGQNEISQGLFTNMSVNEIKAMIPDLINRLSMNIKNIYNLGGRTFWIHNTQPVGCLPYLLTLVPVPDDQKDSVGCSKPYNELAQYFNTMLKEGVRQLRQDLKDAAITYVDVYSAVYSIYQEPEKYGFKLPLVACCGYGGNYNFGETTLCGSNITINGTQTIVRPCKRPSERINWDGIQSTDAGSKVVFNKISTGEFSDPPNSLKMACHTM